MRPSNNGHVPISEVSRFVYRLVFGPAKGVLFIEVSSFQGVLIRGVPAVCLLIEVSSFQGVLTLEILHE